LSGAVTDPEVVESLVAEYTAALPIPPAAPTSNAVAATRARPRRFGGFGGSDWAGCGPNGQFGPGDAP
jgi:hypothetical protein